MQEIATYMHWNGPILTKFCRLKARPALLYRNNSSRRRARLLFVKPYPTLSENFYRELVSNQGSALFCMKTGPLRGIACAMYAI